jgi:hypothetical protein
MQAAVAIAFALTVLVTAVHAQALRQQSSTTSFDGAAPDAAARHFQARQFQPRQEQAHQAQAQAAATMTTPRVRIIVRRR